MPELDVRADFEPTLCPRPIPVILEYTNYRSFLKDSYEYKKSLNAGFSYRRFSQLVGLKSPNYLQLVIQGKRNLTVATAERIAKVLKLQPLEVEYFVALVSEDNATTDKEKLQLYRHRLMISKKLATEFISQSEKAILEKWYHLLILELTSLKDFQPTPDYIGPKLLGLVSAEEIEESLKLLVQLNFIRFEKGKCQRSEPVLSTGFGVFLQTQLQQLHQQQLIIWAQMLEKTNPKEQENHYLNIPIRSQNIPKLQERILQFQDEIIGWLKDEEDPDRVVQLGTYLIPLP